MKKLSLFGLVAVLAVGLLSVGAFAAEKTADTYVSWNYTCNASLTAHNAITEGEIAPDSNLNIVFDDGDFRNVEAESNCGYELTVEADATTYPGSETWSNTLDNFNIELENPPNNWNGNSDINNGWTDFSSSTRDVGEVTFSQAASSSVDYWGVRYRFQADGMSAGDYQVDLTYTLSTNDGS